MIANVGKLDSRKQCRVKRLRPRQRPRWGWEEWVMGKVGGGKRRKKWKGKVVDILFTLDDASLDSRADQEGGGGCYTATTCSPACLPKVLCRVRWKALEIGLPATRKTDLAHIYYYIIAVPSLNTCSCQPAVASSHPMR